MALAKSLMNPLYRDDIFRLFFKLLDFLPVPRDLSGVAHSSETLRGAVGSKTAKYSAVANTFGVLVG